MTATDYSIRGKRIIYENGRAFPPSSATLDIANHMQIADGDTVCDVCCGGGLLSIVAAQLGAASVLATDVDAASLNTAKINGRRNGVTNIEYRLSDGLESVTEIVDVIVSNPPQLPAYIAERFRRPVRSWVEGGGDGTEFITRLIRDSHARLKPEGRLYVPVFSLANPKRSRAALDRYFSCACVSSRAVRVDERHGLDQIDDMWRLAESGVLELELVDGCPSWTIEIYEGKKRAHPQS